MQCHLEALRGISPTQKLQHGHLDILLTDEAPRRPVFGSLKPSIAPPHLNLPALDVAPPERDPIVLLIESGAAAQHLHHGFGQTLREGRRSRLSSIDLEHDRANVIVV